MRTALLWGAQHWPLPESPSCLQLRAQEAARKFPVPLSLRSSDRQVSASASRRHSALLGPVLCQTPVKFSPACRSLWCGAAGVGFVLWWIFHVLCIWQSHATTWEAPALTQWAPGDGSESRSHAVQVSDPGSGPWQLAQGGLSGCGF